MKLFLVKKNDKEDKSDFYINILDQAINFILNAEFIANAKPIKSK